VIALGTVCLAASATTDRYPVLRRVSALTREGENAVAHCDRVQALSDFRKAERLEPAGYRAHLQLSSIYSALGRKRQAIEEHEWAVRLRPEVRRDSVKLSHCGRAEERCGVIFPGGPRRSLIVRPQAPASITPLERVQEGAEPLFLHRG